MDNENQRTGRELCGICGKPIEKGDAVYCPECGTPMHRLCYNMTHRCPNEDFHKYTAPSSGSATEPAGPLCDICKEPLDNGEEKVYCPECGTPVHRSCWDKTRECPNTYLHTIGFDWEKEHRKREEPPARDLPGQSGGVWISFDDLVKEIEETPIRSEDDGEELTCLGVSQAELLHFLGINNISTARFFPLFMKMANTGKIFSVNLSALFFAPFYHFYRRMTGPAILLTVARFILMIPTVFYEMAYWNSRSGDGRMFFAGGDLDSLAAAANVLSVILQILLLLFTDYIYMRWTVNKILSIREKYKNADTREYYEALAHSGNPRMLYVLGGISLMLFLLYVMRFIFNFYAAG